MRITPVDPWTSSTCSSRETMFMLVDRLRRVGATRIGGSYARTLLIHRRHRPFSRNNSSRGRTVERKHVCGISSASPPTQILNLGRRPRAEFSARSLARFALRASAVLPYKGSWDRSSSVISSVATDKSCSAHSRSHWLTFRLLVWQQLPRNRSASIRQRCSCTPTIGEIHV